MNELFERVNTMPTAQYTLLDQSASRIYDVEAKSKQMAQELDKMIDSKIENASNTLFENHKCFESKVHNVIKSLLEFKEFTDRIESNIVGNLNISSKIKTLFR